MHYHTREPRAKRLSHQLLENIDIFIDIRVTYIKLLCTIIIGKIARRTTGAKDSYF